MSKEIKDKYNYLENNISVSEFMEYCKDNKLTCAYHQSLYDSIVDGLLEMSIDKTTMSRITFKQAKESYETVSENWWHDEQKDYECTYDLDNEYDAEAIPTEELNKEHAYAHLRILEDYFNKRGEL
tara:strand:- start:198 stop:575 length:378 start_codon:yes stop_codon:yes gene_type:complete